MKINLGGGDRRYEGFVNVDYDAHCNPEFQLDIEKEVWPFEDNSVDAVIAHHIMEHLGEGFFHVMKEMYRVCKHSTIIDIVVPHPRHWTFIADPTHRRPIIPEGLQLFSKKYNDLCKEQNSAASRLGYYFDVDFELMDSFNVPDSNYIPVFEGKQKVEVEQYMYEHNNIILEIHIKLLVIKE